MKRSQREALADDALNIVVYDDGLAVVLTTVEYAVADSLDLADIGEYAVILIYESVEDHLNRDLMVRHRIKAYEIFLARCLVGKLAVDTDSLGITLGKNVTGGCLKELELAGRTSAIDN